MELVSFAATIERLKIKVQEMLSERQQLQEQSETAIPSDFWVEILSVYRYLMNLSADDFRNIRFHTELVTGELIGSYWHPHPLIDPEEFAFSLGYQDLLSDLPEAYWISEPPTPYLPKLMGVEYQGLVINRTVARHQIAIANMYHVGLLKTLLESRQKQLIVEVGGGFGGLAHQLGNILGDRATYLIIDLPEMALFQVPFLAVNNPEKSIYIYDAETFTPDFLRNGIYDYDFVFVPNYALNQLKVLEEIGVMINMQSFQEMTATQVREYVEFGTKRIQHYFYSDNADHHPHNLSNLVSVSQILEEYLDLYPSQAYYEQLFQGTNWRWSRYYKKFFGVPQGHAAKLPLESSMITMHHANENGQLQRKQPQASAGVCN
ncbi:putative sugar O-methyltransferase [Kovacikia minuta CCNUW1]|uniref:putative sugar O-methyltransferase n=1 Tax=Kovacikia minuta TaxID=2931930 RepID=UPI001CCB78A1|nr:putative sugar O-methyltransferase [Kovacikia minuta]UBF25411.1 putative sugar O-methyltransferase [Kovacikia minuta CCNUW1]